MPKNVTDDEVVCPMCSLKCILGHQTFRGVPANTEMKKILKFTPVKEIAGLSPAEFCRKNRKNA